MEKEEDAVIRLRALQDRLAAAKAAAAQPGAPAGNAAAVAVAAAADAPASAGEGGGGSGGAAGLPPVELEQLRSEMVDFHGELVLLLHWSLVNYAAVAKILKKHDKLTGSRLRAPVLASVLHQPFLSTESISQLVKAAERHVQELTQLCGGSARPGGGATSEARSAGGTASAAAPTSSTSGVGEEAALDPEAELAGSEHVAIFKRTRAALHMLNDMQQHASTPSTLLPPQAAASDAAPDKKRRMSSEQQQQQQQQDAEAQQQQQQQPQ
ncbi:hypothetical protein COHA_005263 [Chlorella ohadii]|uniref:SPX domain-containing protein n=1 Tax=Chlorella ohadii TaxID=2649997 RepID=A0AAD5DS93_9CHLO|nr:hypothetical protein COHA_005263 [Chlorella ohadii]